MRGFWNYNSSNSPGGVASIPPEFSMDTPDANFLGCPDNVFFGENVFFWILQPFDAAAVARPCLCLPLFT